MKTTPDLLQFSNLHEGMGDVLACLWWVQALEDAGTPVRFWTQKPEIAKLWHEDSHKIHDAPEEGVIMLYGRLNEAAQSSRGLHRLDIMKGRIPEDVRPSAPARPRLTPTAAALASPPHFATDWGAEVLAQPSKVVLLFPFSCWTHREWPLGHWRMLAERLDGDGLIPVALGEPRHKAQLAGFRRHIYGLPLLQLISLMQRSGTTVANDSGAAHLAATLARPLVRVHAMYGPQVLCYPGEISAYPLRPTCAGCCARPEHGYLRSICGHSCAELAAVSVGQVQALTHQSLTP